MDLNPYQAPSVADSRVLSSEDYDRGLGWLLFSLRGRATRWDYWKGSLILIGGATMLVLVLLMPLMVMGSGTEADPNETGLALFGLISLPLFWSGFAIGVKRWHDRDKSAWWTLVSFVPYVGSIWVFVECGCLRGTQGPNRYGAERRD